MMQLNDTALIVKNIYKNEMVWEMVCFHLVSFVISSINMPSEYSSVYGVQK